MCLHPERKDLRRRDYTTGNRAENAILGQKSGELHETNHQATPLSTPSKPGARFSHPGDHKSLRDKKQQNSIGSRRLDFYRRNRKRFLATDGVGL
jgi:hypothetical protein